MKGPPQFSQATFFLGVSQGRTPQILQPFLPENQE